MNQEFHLDSNDKSPTANLTISVSGTKYGCNRVIAVNSSLLIHQLLSKDRTAKHIDLNFSDDLHQFYLIEKLFMGGSILFSKENIAFLIEVSEFLQISTLTEKSIEFQKYLTDLNEIIEDDEGIQNMMNLEQEIFNLAENSFEIVLEMIENLNSTKAVCQLIINACFSRPRQITMYLQLVTQIKSLDDQNESDSFVKIFVNTMLDPYVEECKTTNEYVEL